MKLLQNEEKLLSSNADKVVLTNYRIMMKDKLNNKPYRISMCLENISSIETSFTSKNAFLGLALFSVFGGYFLPQFRRTSPDFQIYGFIFAIIFVIFWWFSRKHLIKISSNGGANLNFEVENLDEDEINEFVNAVQEAKVNRVNQLNKG